MVPLKLRWVRKIFRREMEQDMTLASLGIVISCNASGIRNDSGTSPICQERFLSEGLGNEVKLKRISKDILTAAQPMDINDSVLRRITWCSDQPRARAPARRRGFLFDAFSTDDARALYG